MTSNGITNTPSRSHSAGRAIHGGGWVSSGWEGGVCLTRILRGGLKGGRSAFYYSVCFFVLCNRHWFNKDPGPDPRGTEMGVTYLPSTISSDAGYADLPLPLLGAPVDIGGLVKLGSRSLAKQDRD